jgi:hypothetical protein
MRSQWDPLPLEIYTPPRCATSGSLCFFHIRTCHGRKPLKALLASTLVPHGRGIHLEGSLPRKHVPARTARFQLVHMKEHQEHPTLPPCTNGDLWPSYLDRRPRPRTTELVRIRTEESQLSASDSAVSPFVDTQDWHMSGLCRGVEPSMFFSPDGERGHARILREARAKRICGHCPVLAQCREHALRVPEPYGIWGGLSEKDRRRHARRRRGRIQRDQRTSNE